MEESNVYDNSLEISQIEEALIKRINLLKMMFV